MPKQIIEINPFHGGMNNNTDPRDLQQEEHFKLQTYKGALRAKKTGEKK